MKLFIKVLTTNLIDCKMKYIEKKSHKLVSYTSFLVGSSIRLEKARKFIKSFIVQSGYIATRNIS